MDSTVSSAVNLPITLPAYGRVWFGWESDQSAARIQGHEYRHAMTFESSHQLRSRMKLAELAVLLLVLSIYEQAIEEASVGVVGI